MEEKLRFLPHLVLNAKARVFLFFVYVFYCWRSDPNPYDSLALGASASWVDTLQLCPPALPMSPCPGFFLVLREAQAFERLGQRSQTSLNRHQDDVSVLFAMSPLAPLP